MASKAYQPEHDPAKWVPVFGKDLPGNGLAVVMSFLSTHGRENCPLCATAGHAVSWRFSWHLASVVSVHQYFRSRS